MYLVLTKNLESHMDGFRIFNNERDARMFCIDYARESGMQMDEFCSCRWIGEYGVLEIHREDGDTKLMLWDEEFNETL